MRFEGQEAICVTETHQKDRTVLSYKENGRDIKCELLNSGDIFINEEKVVISRTVIVPSTRYASAQPKRLSTWQYSSTPFYTGGSYIINGGVTVTNVLFEQAVAFFGQMAFFAVLESLVPGMLAVSQAVGWISAYDALANLSPDDPASRRMYIKEQMWYNTYSEASPKVIRYAQLDYTYWNGKSSNGALINYLGEDTGYGKLTYQT